MHPLDFGNAPLIMSFSTEPKHSQTLLVLFCLTFILWGWGALILAMSGAFLLPLIVLGSAITGLSALVIGGKMLSGASLDWRLVIVAAFSLTALLGYFSEPTVFSGRDQGSLSEAAFRLAQNGKLTFSTNASQSFFPLYGPGTALNFPGFAYTEGGSLITQFPLGYIAWLASFIALLGLEGIQIGNAFLFFLLLISFYGLFRTFVPVPYAAAGLILFISSFLPTWFTKVTLSENLAVFLFVFLAWNLMLFLRDGRLLTYTGALLAAGLLVFTRIEGFAFLALTFALLFFSSHARRLWQSFPWRTGWIPGGFFISLLLWNLSINLPYYKMIGRALQRFLALLEQGLATQWAIPQTSFGLGTLLFSYGLLPVFILGFLGLLVILKKKRFLLLVPSILALPTFLYLLVPNISPDHPWMLRRYLFSIFPALLFSAVIGLALLFAPDRSRASKKILAPPRDKRLVLLTLIFCGLIALQFSAWKRGFGFAENRTLLDQTAAFAREFSPRDLILIDRDASGDGFSMLAGPLSFLFGKNAVYFFNPNDLSKLDLSPYARVFLLVPQDDVARYTSVFGERLVFEKTVSFTTERFETLSVADTASLRLPQKSRGATLNWLFRIE